MRCLAGLFCASILVGQSAPDFESRVKVLEARTGGRLGVFVLDTGTGRELAYRADERFPMCSTFKAILTAAILARVEKGQESLKALVPYSSKDLLAWAPVTSRHVAEGLSVEALCEAAVTQSDNTAANLLLSRLGGPEGYTAYVRTLGDALTRLDRNEPTLNTAIPGDPRDTTTPRAMAQNLQRVLLDQVLKAEYQAKLEGWMFACTTGIARLRAGLPKDWKVADKTGSGGNGTTNDIALLRPPHRAPILVCAYLTAATVDQAAQNATLAEVARTFSGLLGH